MISRKGQADIFWDNLIPCKHSLGGIRSCPYETELEANIFISKQDNTTLLPFLDSWINNIEKVMNR